MGQKEKFKKRSSKVKNSKTRNCRPKELGLELLSGAKKGRKHQTRSGKGWGGYTKPELADEKGREPQEGLIYG